MAVRGACADKEASRTKRRDRADRLSDQRPGDTIFGFPPLGRPGPSSSIAGPRSGIDTAAVFDPSVRRGSVLSGAT